MKPSAQEITTNTQSAVPVVPKNNIQIIVASVIIAALLSIVGILAYQNSQLKGQIVTLNKSKSGPMPTPTGSQTENMTQTYSGHGYSFMYPEDLFARKTSILRGSSADFYLDEYHANKTQECINQKADTLENPCGFGWLIFSVEIFINPEDKS